MKCSIFYLKSKRMGLHTDKTRCENLNFCDRIKREKNVIFTFFSLSYGFILPQN